MLLMGRMMVMAEVSPARDGRYKWEGIGTGSRGDRWRGGSVPASVSRYCCAFDRRAFAGALALGARGRQGGPGARAEGEARAASSPPRCRPQILPDRPRLRAAGTQAPKGRRTDPRRRL